MIAWLINNGGVAPFKALYQPALWMTRDRDSQGVESLNLWPSGFGGYGDGFSDQLAGGF